MALHRDIYWIGRQWAVTGCGIQAVDQRLKGMFDIEGSRLGEAGLIEGLRQLPWFNEADFAKAFAVACGRFPDVDSSANASILERAAVIQAEPVAMPPPEIKLRLGPQPAPAKFLPQWRIRR